MATTKIRLTEAELHTLISEAINEYMNEETDENKAGDFARQGLSFAKTLFNKNKTYSGGTRKERLMSRFDDAAQNWTTQGKINDLVNLRDALRKYVEDGKLSPDMTIGSLIGMNKMGGRMNGQIGNYTKQIKNHGGDRIKTDFNPFKKKESKPASTPENKD